MRKFYISLIVASFFATATFAGNFRSDNSSVWEKHVGNKSGKIELRSISPVNPVKHVKADADENDKPITKQPDGTLIKNLYVVSGGYHNTNLGMKSDYVDGKATDLVETDDNLYIHNPVSMLTTNSWIKGEKKKAEKTGEPDSVLVKLPVPIYEANVKTAEGKDSLAMLYLQNIDFDEIKGTVSIADDQFAKYTWNGDTLQSVSQYILGLVDKSGNWYQYGDYSLTLIRLKDKAVTVPEGAIKGYYNIEYQTDPETKKSFIVKGAREGDDYYVCVGDLIYVPDLYAKGTMKDGKVVFDKQYLGVDTFSNQHKFFYPVKATYKQSWMGYDLDFVDELDKGLTFDADNDGNLRTDSAFIISGSKSDVQATGYVLFDKADLSVWEDKLYTPKAPEIGSIGIFFPNLDVKDDYGQFMFNLYAESTDGVALLEDNLYYNIYLDDKLYTFTPDKYKGLAEEMTDIPDAFNDGGIDFTTRGTGHIVKIHENNFTKFGIQAVYKYGDQVAKSEIVEKADPSNISIVSTGGEVKSITYYDLSGRKIKDPSTGVFIKTVKSANGSVKSVKIVK